MKGKKNRRRRLNYLFDNYISTGFGAQFVLLFVAILLMVLVMGLLASLLSTGTTVGKGIWQALLHILDQGTISGDETDDFGYIAVMLLVTFLGMAFTGTIVGIINNAMSAKLDELKKGHSQIAEEGHVVIFGFDENIYTLVSQMQESNRNWDGNRKIAVVDRLDKEEMEHLAKEHEQLNRNYRDNGFKAKSRRQKDVIYRTGSIDSENTYAMASIQDARAIIINEDDDFDVIRVILGIVSYLKKQDAYMNDRMPTIVTMMHEKENITAAECAAGVEHGLSEAVRDTGDTRFRVLFFESILAHVFAQVCRQPGLSWVISELFNYEDSEFYIESQKKNHVDLAPYFEGKSFAEISEMMVNSIAVGIQSGTKIILNPDPGTVFHKGDKIIHLAVDDNQIQLAGKVDPECLYSDPGNSAEGEKAYHFLIFGWSLALPEIINDIDQYASEKGTIRIITRHQSEEEAAQKELNCPYQKRKKSRKAARSIQDIGSLQHLELLDDERMDPYDWENVNEYLERTGTWDEKNPDFPTNIIILCQDGIPKEESDEKVAVLLLNIREFLRKRGFDRKINITTEVNLPENQRLLQDPSINDFIVGSEMANRMMVQVANNPDINAVFMELLKDKGSELYLRKLSEYVDLSRPFTFKDIERNARSRCRFGEDRQEVAIGWLQVGEKMDVPSVKMNPQGEERFGAFPIGDADPENFRVVVMAIS